MDNCIREGHSTTLIRDSVLSTLEGRPHHTAMTAMEDGNGSLKSIMTALDQVYWGVTMYTALLHKLNSIQQAHGELAKDYYECVVQIRVKLQEFHCYMFRPGNLECQAKEAFFNRLHPEFESMVVHKRDNPSEYHEITCCHEGMRGESGEQPMNSQGGVCQGIPTIHY